MKKLKYDVVIRNGMKILVEMKFDIDLLGEVVILVFDLLVDFKFLVVIKVYFMQLIVNICEVEFDFVGELRILIEDQWEEGIVGFKFRGKKILK